MLQINSISEYDTEPFKIVCIGSSTVGKSSIVERYCSDHFDDKHGTTIGASMFSRNIIAYDDEGEMHMIKVHIWETGGQERFFSAVPMYLRNADVIIFVFDASDCGFSLNHLIHRWLPLVERQTLSPVLFFTVGNKVDLLSDTEFEYLQKDLSKRNLPEVLSNIYYTSAKNNYGIDTLFKHIAEDLTSSDFLERKRKFDTERLEGDIIHLLPEYKKDRIWSGCCVYKRLRN